MSRAVIGYSESGGGIIWAGSFELMRRQASDASGLPGTMGVMVRPVLSFLASLAFSGRSSRRSALLALRSWPWHLKQVFAMMGRTSRLNCTAEGSGASGGVALASVAVRRPITGAIPSLVMGVMIRKK